MAGNFHRNPHLNFEGALWGTRVFCVAGVDEAGRGAWAGPVCAAAVILPPDPCCLSLLDGVRDSKLMTPAARRAWAPLVRSVAVSWALGWASAEEIDRVNILQATRLAMQRALACLQPQAEHLLIDAVRLPLETPQTALIHGDMRSLSIAAASVLAKTARDAWMTQADGQFRGYGFASHMGYGTAQHQQAIARLGPCSIHRMSYQPLCEKPGCPLPVES